MGTDLARALAGAVEQALGAYLFDTAAFLAERLCAEAPGEGSTHTLGRCLYAGGQVAAAYSVLKGCTAPQARYLFARCCLALGKALEGEEVLKGVVSEQQVAQADSGCPGAVALLLADFCRKNNLAAQAESHYRDALIANPFLWPAAARLCEMDAQVQFPPYFVAPQHPAPVAAPVAATPTAAPVGGASGSEDSDGLATFSTPTAVAPQQAKAPRKAPPPQKKPRPPTASFKRAAPGPAAAREGPRTRSRKHRLSDSESESSATDHNAPPQAPTKATTRPSRTLRPSTLTAAPVTRPAASHAPAPAPRSRPAPAPPATMGQGTGEPAMALLLGLAEAYQALCRYQCPLALDRFRQLPPAHQATGWVQAMVARAHVEMANYRAAEQAYVEVRRLAPHQLLGMDTYSTVLWHLRKEKVLSGLAHELVEQHKASPETWCVVGNCFSVQKEHVAAQKFFERAIQVEPGHVYAYTLLGHEHVCTEDMERALGCFRTAIMLDGRHYNGWYGLGMVYYRQEKHELAKYHFLKAADINRHNAVLHTYIGMVLLARRRHEEALQRFTEGLRLDRRNPLAKYQRASVLAAMDRTQEALCELEELAGLAPKEPSVYLLMARLHKRAGSQDQAIKYLTWARDLDPRGVSGQMREAMGQQALSEEDEEAHDIAEDQ